MRSDLNYPRFWLMFGAVWVLIAWILNLMPATELQGVHMNDKVQHILGYVLLTLYFCGVYPPSRYLRVALAFAAMGALVEVLQGAMHWGRMQDVHDFYADCLGIALGMGSAWLGLRHWPRWIEMAFVRS